MYLFPICKIILSFFCCCCCHFALCYEHSVGSWWDIAACRAQIQYSGALQHALGQAGKENNHLSQRKSFQVKR